MKNERKMPLQQIKNKKLVYILLLFVPLLTNSCNSNKASQHYDTKRLLKQKCGNCHNLDMPPYTSSDEKAPPMMAVAFHIVNFIDTNDESQRIYKAKNFVMDYVLNPSAEKSFCDKESLKSYGVMPSQKGKITTDELKTLTEYIFENYTQKNLLKAQKEKRRFDALPKGKKLAFKYKCMGCHKEHKKIIGPSFEDIAKRYPHAKNKIQNSIYNGSKNKWKNSNKAIMPSFKDMNKKDADAISKWILNFAKT